MAFDSLQEQVPPGSACESHRVHGVLIPSVDEKLLETEVLMRGGGVDSGFPGMSLIGAKTRGTARRCRSAMSNE